MDSLLLEHMLIRTVIQMLIHIVDLIDIQTMEEVVIVIIHVIEEMLVAEVVLGMLEIVIVDIILTEIADHIQEVADIANHIGQQIVIIGL